MLDKHMGLGIRSKVWVVTCIFLIFSLIVSACTLYCSDEVDVSISGISTMEEGNRASIKKLSNEIRRCPSANKYRVFWKVTVNGQEVSRRAALYERNIGVGYEDDPYSGFSSKVYPVDDSAIHAIAQKGGTFDDFVDKQ